MNFQPARLASSWRSASHAYASEHMHMHASCVSCEPASSSAWRTSWERAQKNQQGAVKDRRHRLAIDNDDDVRLLVRSWTTTNMVGDGTTRLSRTSYGGDLRCCTSPPPRRGRHERKPIDASGGREPRGWRASSHTNISMGALSELLRWCPV
jgi:hypothetical protein